MRGCLPVLVLTLAQACCLMAASTRPAVDAPGAARPASSASSATSATSSEADRARNPLSLSLSAPGTPVSRANAGEAIQSGRLVSARTSTAREGNANKAATVTAARAATTTAAGTSPAPSTANSPFMDDVDPPVSFPSLSAEEPDWPARDLHAHVDISGPEAADQRSKDVRSMSTPSGSDRIWDAEALVRMVTAPSPEEDTRRHPLNSKKCGLSKGALSNRIVGGEVATLGLYPWLARIGYNLVGVPRRVYRCAGAVITHFHILTAAHCVKDLPLNFEFAGVRLGEWDTSTDPDCQDSICAPPVQDIDPEAVIIHQDYNSPRFANDIALVKLAQRINFNGWVGPVCIPYGDLLTKSYESERTEVAGWGTYDITLQKSSQELRMVHLPIVSNAICHALYRNVADITRKQLCAGGEIGFDACSGDSGGPLVKVEAYSGVPRYYIVGIVSFGSKRCGLTPAPGVYTRVSYYIDWILDNILPT